MPQLDPTWFASQLFWLFVCFVTLYIILARLVLPPLQNVLAQRQKTMEGDVSTAQSLKSQAEQAREHYEQTLAEARNRSQQLVAQVMAEQKARAEQSGKALDAQISQKLGEAEKAIAAKKQALMDALTPATAEMTAMIVEKLTQRAPANDKVNSIISEISKARSNQG